MDNFPFDRYDEIVDVMHKTVWYLIFLFLVKMWNIHIDIFTLNLNLLIVVCPEQVHILHE